jgi:hypothetical protein
MKYIAATAPQDQLLVLGQEPGGRRVVFQQRNVRVHNEDRDRHGIEKNSMKTLIKKLNSDLGHNKPSLSRLKRVDKQIY